MSRSLIDADAAMLDAMIRGSSSRIATVGITGMLWFDGANFAQVLAGADGAVSETMERIKADPRHANLEIVLDRDVKARAFGKWGDD